MKALPDIRESKGGWYQEKVGFVLKAIARTCDTVENTKDLSQEAREDLRLNLIQAAWNATLLFAFVSEAEFLPAHVEAITQHGYEGYQDLALLYGAIEETDRQRALIEYRSFADEILPLLNGPRSNRREINAALDRRLPVGRLMIAEVEKLTDDVNLGNIDWNSYSEAVRAVLTEKLEELETRAQSWLVDREQRRRTQ